MRPYFNVIKVMMCVLFMVCNAYVPRMLDVLNSFMNPPKLDEALYSDIIFKISSRNLQGIRRTKVSRV